MWIRDLGFLLLIVFPGLLKAQSAKQSCGVPILPDGVYSPKKESYSHGMSLVYACNTGRNAAMGDSWATSTCQNGKWSHEPQCINPKACFPPLVLNAKFTKTPKRWYDEGLIVQIICDEGYEAENHYISAICIDGAWSTTPVCKKSTSSCHEPPKIPHAVVVYQEYQELFVGNSVVQYECQDGYTVDGPERRKTIHCIAGTWSQGPTCSSTGDSPTGGTADHTLQFRPINLCGAYPNVPNAAVVQEDRFFLKYQCSAYYKLESSDTVKCLSNGKWTHQPICAGTFCVLSPAQYFGSDVLISDVIYLNDGEIQTLPCARSGSTTSVRCMNGRLTFTVCPGSSGLEMPDNQPFISTIGHCGTPPIVLDGVSVEVTQIHLKYQCSSFYKLVGPERVVCFPNGKWSAVPRCIGNFCTLNTNDHLQLKPAETQYIRHGETVTVECVVSAMPTFSNARCVDSILSVSRCL